MMTFFSFYFGRNRVKDCLLILFVCLLLFVFRCTLCCWYWSQTVWGSCQTDGSEYQSSFLVRKPPIAIEAAVSQGAASPLDYYYLLPW